MNFERLYGVNLILFRILQKMLQGLLLCSVIWNHNRKILFHYLILLHNTDGNNSETVRYKLKACFIFNATLYFENSIPNVNQSYIWTLHFASEYVSVAGMSYKCFHGVTMTEDMCSPIFQHCLAPPYLDTILMGTEFNSLAAFSSGEV